MKYLLTGAAVIASFALSLPAGAQPASPSAGNAMGTPGPNPGGPGLTPSNTGPNPGGAALSGPRTAPPPSMSDTSSAMPPTHRASRHASHGKPSHHPSRFPNLQGNTVANELNEAELSRLQSGNFTPPPPPELSSGGASEMSPTANPDLNRMSRGGRATSGTNR